MIKEMWANGKTDQARYTRIPGLNLVTLGCVGFPRKPNKSANKAQNAGTAPGQLLESEKDTAKTLDFID